MGDDWVDVNAKQKAKRERKARESKKINEEDAVNAEKEKVS